MARLVTIGDLRDRARQRADMENSDFISNTEFLSLLDKAFTEMVDFLTVADIHLFETSTTFTSVGSDSFLLPADHYKTLAIDYKVSSTQWRALTPITFAERNSYLGAYNEYGSASGYRVAGFSLILYPVPTSGQVYRHIYVPTPQDLTVLDDPSEIDGIAGYDELLVVMAAKKAKIKEESDISDLVREEKDLKERILQMASQRDQGSKRIINVTSVDYQDRHRSRRYWNY